MSKLFINDSDVDPKKGITPEVVKYHKSVKARFGSWKGLQKARDEFLKRLESKNNQHEK